MTTDAAIAASGTAARNVRRFRTAASLFAVIVLLVLAAFLLSAPLRLQPDEIVRDTGNYLSPAGRFRIVVEPSHDDMLAVRFVPRMTWQSLVDWVTMRSPPRQMPLFAEFEFERDWFLCFDEYDRLWLFIGSRDPAIAPRQTSSGGTVPRVQSVMMEGFIFRRGQPLGMTAVVSDTGDWRGVPPGFFEQIPERHGSRVSVWGEIPPIPAEPPAFTPAERAAATAYLRRLDVRRASQRVF